MVLAGVPKNFVTNVSHSFSKGLNKRNYEFAKVLQQLPGADWPRHTTGPLPSLPDESRHGVR
jgi:hypothetical protein